MNMINSYDIERSEDYVSPLYLTLIFSIQFVRILIYNIDIQHISLKYPINVTLLATSQNTFTV